MDTPTTTPAPGALYDEDDVAVYLRCDDRTRGQAQAFFDSEMGLDFTEVAVHKVYMRIDPEYVKQMMADGAEEPYDGWPWQECSRRAPDATPYFRGSRRDGDNA
jgi:hypothetical protein